jgi:hypothetical protein
MIDAMVRFVWAHRDCGELRGDVEIPRPDGYLVWIVCVCGEVFEYWMTAEEASRELVHSSLLSSPN